MRCQLSRLQKGHATDEWFLLSSHIPLKGIEPGSLRVRARYSMEKIMPEEEYSEFKEVLFTSLIVFNDTKQKYLLFNKTPLS
jgi:Ras GTPase-activating protein 1